ncbi:autoinducer 2 ABC transporter substrate-binding protein [Thermotoga caldifontis]|uniref:autoinducer 2 ABC transporter substrate-binding protein n=1 Tax=Thermotoga caldifontis TaxID=1508419 RepID=UPI000597DA44|nr:autoinducer 2 ABC transporter substrate-binding protein [Thermotoga caldifontis]
MRKSLLTVVLVVALVMFLITTGLAAPKKNITIAVVVKSVAFNWFQRMEVGIKQFAKDYGVTAFMQGPPVADSAQQIAIIEQLIAQGVDAIVIVPYGVKEHEMVQKEAMEKGIIVVTHEAARTAYAHFDLEAFVNEEYGEEMMRQLAKRMNYEGEYVQFVGSYTNDSHNQWMDAARAYQEANYPNMKCIGKFETREDQAVGYNIMKDLLKRYPNIKGVLGSAAGDVVAAGRAIQEAGLADKIAVVGTSIVSYAGELLKTGAVDLAMCWDPALAGYAACVVAYKLLIGEKIEEGMNLGVPGYESIKIVKNEHGVPVIYGKGWIFIDASNMDQYNF